MELFFGSMLVWVVGIPRERRVGGGALRASAADGGGVVDGADLRAKKEWHEG